ncbi:hypothetical protein AAY473_038861 [Plecturocebus cupreus]
MMGETMVYRLGVVAHACIPSTLGGQGRALKQRSRRYLDFLEVILERVNEEIAHGLPGSLDHLSLAQLEVQLIRGLLKFLESFEGLIYFSLPVSGVQVQFFPLGIDLLSLLSCRPGLHDQNTKSIGNKSQNRQMGPNQTPQLLHSKRNSQ